MAEEGDERMTLCDNCKRKDLCTMHPTDTFCDAYTVIHKPKEDNIISRR